MWRISRTFRKICLVVEKTRNVERVIGALRKIYTVLQSTLPIDYSSPTAHLLQRWQCPAHWQDRLSLFSSWNVSRFEDVDILLFKLWGISQLLFSVFEHSSRFAILTFHYSSLEEFLIYTTLKFWTFWDLRILTFCYISCKEFYVYPLLFLYLQGSRMLMFQ